jgi:predicted CoA-binding protein
MWGGTMNRQRKSNFPSFKKIKTPMKVSRNYWSGVIFAMLPKKKYRVIPVSPDRSGR